MANTVQLTKNGQPVFPVTDESLVTGLNYRPYDSQSPNGMGYLVLEKDKTFASQVTAANTIYEIRYDFDLDNASVTIPAGCVLKFNGGSIVNGTVVGNNTRCENRTASNFTAAFRNVFEDSENVIIDGSFSGNATEIAFSGKHVLLNNIYVTGLKLSNCYITGECTVNSATGLILGDNCRLANARIKNVELTSISQNHTGVLVEGDNVEISNCEFDSFYKGIQCSGRLTTITNCKFNEPTAFELEHPSEFYTCNIKFTKKTATSATEAVPRNILVDSCKFGTCTDNCLDFFTGGRDITISNCIFDNNTTDYVEIKSIATQGRQEGFNTIDDTDKNITFIKCVFKKNVSNVVAIRASQSWNSGEDTNIRSEKIVIDSCELLGCKILLTNMFDVNVVNSNIDFSSLSDPTAFNIDNSEEILLSNNKFNNAQVRPLDSTVTIDNCSFSGYSSESTPAIVCSKAVPARENFLRIKGSQFDGRIMNLTGGANNIYVDDCVVNCAGAHIFNGDGANKHKLYLTNNKFYTTYYLFEKVKGYFFFRGNMMNVNSYARVYDESFFDCADDIITQNSTIIRCSPATNTFSVKGSIEYINGSNVSITQAQGNVDVVFNNSENAKNGTTTQRQSVSNPAVGYMFFDTTLGKMVVWNGSAWVNMDGTALS